MRSSTGLPAVRTARAWHLFHDLGGFRDVAGHGYGPVSLGMTNIDHVILSGAQWLLVDAKGTGAGVLTTDATGKGVLIRGRWNRRAAAVAG